MKLNINLLNEIDYRYHRNIDGMKIYEMDERREKCLFWIYARIDDEEILCMDNHPTSEMVDSAVVLIKAAKETKQPDEFICIASILDTVCIMGFEEMKLFLELLKSSLFDSNDSISGMA